MNPAFWGRHGVLVCTDCQALNRVDIKFVQHDGPVQCWHCGATSDLSDLQKSEGPPDTVWIKPVESRPRNGDVVLVNVEGKHRLKRILASPGQTLDRSPDLAKTVPNGTSKAISGWPQVTVYSDLWGQTLKNRWEFLDGYSLGWAYTHRNVYRGNRPSEILDDYPGNVGVAQPLRPVTVIGVDFDWPTDDPNMIVEFRVGGMHSIVNSGHRLLWDGLVPRFRFTSRDSVRSSPQTGPFIGPSVIVRTDVRPTNIHIWRQITYPWDGPKLTLGPEQWFVMGDNYPVSIDSREWGPIHSDQIIGVLDSTNQVS